MLRLCVDGTALRDVTSFCETCYAQFGRAERGKIRFRHIDIGPGRAVFQSIAEE